MNESAGGGTAPAIEVLGLRKSYGPDGLTFTVPRGSICGFLGPNGAGKTTTIRILMGFARSEEGSARLLGTAAGSTHEIFRRVAFVPEVKELYPFARAGEMIRLTRGFYPQWDLLLEQRLVAELEIPLQMRCTKLSKGMRAKLWLLLALCRRAELLVLDEPTDGLDPIAIEQALRLLVEQAAERGATVFFSSHQLAEVEQISDHIVMIHRGRCVASGDLDEVRRRYRRVQAVIEGDEQILPAAFAGWRRDGRMLTGYSDLNLEELKARLAESGVRLVDSSPATLKEIFFDRAGRA